MQNDILNNTMTYLTSNWVCDEDVYPWREDFIETYFVARFYYVHECLDMIDHDAQTYIHIIKKVYDYSVNNNIDIDITNPLELFNLYYYILAREIIYHDNNIKNRINEIRRIQKMEYVVPLVLHSIPIHPVRTTIMTYLSSTY